MAFIVWGITFCDTPKITIHAALSSFTCTLKQRETLTEVNPKVWTVKQSKL